jgi:hypothetical protein
LTPQGFRCLLLQRDGGLARHAHEADGDVLLQLALWLVAAASASSPRAAVRPPSGSSRRSCSSTTSRSAAPRPRRAPCCAARSPCPPGQTLAQSGSSARGARRSASTFPALRRCCRRLRAQG